MGLIRNPDRDDDDDVGDEDASDDWPGEWVPAKPTEE